MTEHDWFTDDVEEQGYILPEAPFFAKIAEAPSGCWEWQASRNPLGYGQFNILLLNGRRRPLAAHRLSWEFFNGPIPHGLVLDHLCRNPPCVNPEHLDPVPQAVNMQRAHGWTRTSCPRGHGPEHWRRRGERGLACRTCLYDLNRSYKEAKSA